jgi:hypothetical protein
MTEPPRRSPLQRAMGALALQCNAAQSRFAPESPGWIHMLFWKGETGKVGYATTEFDSRSTADVNGSGKSSNPPADPAPRLLRRLVR